MNSGKETEMFPDAKTASVDWWWDERRNSGKETLIGGVETFANLEVLNYGVELEALWVPKIGNKGMGWKMGNEHQLAWSENARSRLPHRSCELTRINIKEKWMSLVIAFGLLTRYPAAGITLENRD